MESSGVIYFNTGTSCVARLAVSLSSLRQHYTGNVSILSIGDASHSICNTLAGVFDASLIEWQCNVAPGKNFNFLSKTCFHESSPYDLTVSIDSDTLILGPLDDLFQMAKSKEFCIAQFSNWTTSGKVYSKRIRQWAPIAEDKVIPALRFGPAINTGVMAFKKSASIFQKWGQLAERGRNFFIPDEVSCQLLLPEHAHAVISSDWNCSCKFDNPRRKSVRIIHYHGKKHCRPGLPFHSDLWVERFMTLMHSNVASIRGWMPAGDKHLVAYLDQYRNQLYAIPNNSTIDS